MTYNQTLPRRTFAASIVSVVTAAVLALSPASAAAATAAQTVSGTTLSALSLVATPAAFSSGFSPGNTATTTATLTAVDTNPSWSITVQDNASGTPGKMVAAGTGCTGSAASMTNATTVQLSSALGGVTIPGSPITISGSAQTVASATSQLLAASVFTTNYSVVIPSAETMTSGCVYSMTATYTLQ